MKKNLMAKAGNALVSYVALGILPIAVTYSLCKEAKNKIESKIYKLRNKDILKDEED